VSYFLFHRLFDVFPDLFYRMHERVDIPYPFREFFFAEGIFDPPGEVVNPSAETDPCLIKMIVE